MSEFFEQVWAGVQADFADLPGVAQFTRIVLRLVVAAALGGILGFQREVEGKAAGLRTYMLVSLGAAFFYLVPDQMDMSGITRVTQGIISGIGFLGAGAIIKREQGGHV